MKPYTLTFVTTHTHTHTHQNEADIVLLRDQNPPRVGVRPHSATDVKWVFYLITGVERRQQHHGTCRRTINVLIFGFQSKGAKESERNEEQQKKEKQERSAQAHSLACPGQCGKLPQCPLSPLSSQFQLFETWSWFQQPAHLFLR